MCTKKYTRVTVANLDNEPEGIFLANDQNDQSSSKNLWDTATRVTKILDAKYEQADLPSIVDKINSIKNNEKQILLKILKNLNQCLMES